jgi:ABC-type branched-subunit amino acid transport system ATPase component
MSLLEVQGLKKQFGGLSAISDLSFAVEEGEIVSIIGPNGAGKSTLFNVITALYEPEGGEVLFDSDPLVGSHGWASLGRSRPCTCSQA